MARIGSDEWVAEIEERRERYTGLKGQARRIVERVPPSARLGLAVGAAALFPLFANSGDLFRYGLFTLLYALLALGLNITVGYAGLLDLGYIAFFGFGAYSYALLSSNQFHVHWPAEAAIPLVVIASALVGFLLGLTSRRLLGDYLAIVTLFFGQAFVTVTSNGNRITLLGFTKAKDVTGGPNGIPGVDPLSFFGYQLTTIKDYFYLALITFALVITGLHFLNESRTGRAWRALREDPLAAELMGMPVKRLKLLAFALGAATAGLTGTIFAAATTGVFPGEFDVSVLILIYAMVILGGAGSLAGVVLGAVVINVTLEELRTPGPARWIFYSVVLIALIGKLRPWRRLAAVLAGTVGFGFAVHAIVAAAWPRGTEGAAPGGGTIERAIDSWVVLPADVTNLGNYAYVALIVAVIALTRMRGIARTVGLVPVLYLAAFVWENRLVGEPSVTRLILLGAILIALMHARPQGLLGTARVEIA